MRQPLRLLIVEDSKEDAELLLGVLRPAGYDPAYEVVADAAAMRKALVHQDWDLITSDQSMPQFDAPSALALTKELRPDAPFIVVTGENRVELAVSLMKCGAKDYILKDELARVVPTIEEVMREVETKRERQLAEQSLKISEARYRRLFETAQDGILILDANTGQITDVNPYLIQMLGYSLEDFVGKKLWEIGTFKNSEASKSTFLALQSQGYVRYEDLPLQSFDGRQIDVEFVSNVYMVGDEKVIQCNIRSISRRKDDEATIREVNAELEQRLKDRGIQLAMLTREAENLNYSIAHGLGAPLRWISGFSRSLLDDYGSNLDAGGQNSIENIRASVERMSIMLAALMEVARFSRIELTRHPVDLTARVYRIVSELRRNAPSQYVEFVIAGGITANCDPKLLQKVLENLLNNACKFTAKKKDARIEFGTTPQTDGRIAYFVRDNGIGFDMAYADRLFGVFQHLHDEKEYPGTGIGLAIVERIIHRHGGQVWAEGAQNSGATFYFSL